MGRGRRGAELLAAELSVGTSEGAWRAGAAGRQWGCREGCSCLGTAGTWLSLYYLRINLC